MDHLADTECMDEQAHWRMLNGKSRCMTHAPWRWRRGVTCKSVHRCDGGDAASIRVHSTPGSGRTKDATGGVEEDPVQMQMSATAAMAV